MSSILSQSPYFFDLYFCLDAVFISMNFVRFIIVTWRNWNVVIYIVKICCLILEAFGTVRHSIFCYHYIQSTSLNILYAIYESWERSEQIYQCSMILGEQSHYNFNLCSQNVSSHHGWSQTCVPMHCEFSWENVIGPQIITAVWQIAKRWVQNLLHAAYYNDQWVECLQTKM